MSAFVLETDMSNTLPLLSEAHGLASVEGDRNVSRWSITIPGPMWSL